jgi:hypothetical protein
VQVAEQHVEAVDPAGVLGDQVLAALGEQTHDRGVVLDLDAVEAPVVQCNGGDREGVGDVSLARTARSQQAGSRRQLRGDIENLLASGDELLGDTPSESGGALDSPLPRRPLGCPGEQRRRSGLVHDEPDRPMGLAVGLDRDGGQGALVGVDADRDHQSMPSSG